MVTVSATELLDGGHQFLARQQDRISRLLVAEEAAWREEILSSGLQPCLHLPGQYLNTPRLDFATYREEGLKT